MIRLRPGSARGHFDHGWLRTWHTFSFADYHDPDQVGFRALRVLNEDIVQPGAGFDLHPHRDMEIVTWILSGTLRHQDSMGHVALLRAGEVQAMSAGTGILHSEHNASATEPVHLLQIWLLPRQRGLPPRHARAAVDLAAARPRPVLLAAPPAEPAPVAIHQDARILGARLEPGDEAALALAPGRHAWVQVARGALTCNGTPLGAGDGAALPDAGALRLAGREAGTEVLVFDLA